MTPLILGLAGPVLTEAERGFFREVAPAGFILFKRNIVDRAQVKVLTDALRSIAGRDDVPILIDQEGGRVARMQPPEWPAFPRGSDFDRLYDLAPMSAIEAVRANAQALALMVREAGGVFTDLEGKPPALDTTSVLAGTPAIHAQALERMRDIRSG